MSLASRVVLAAALLTAVVLAASGLGSRAGLWDFRLGFTLLRYGAWAGAGVAAASLLVLLAGLLRRRRGVALAAVLALAVAGLPVLYVRQLTSSSPRVPGVPPIHDISTDLADPPAIAALPGVPPRSLAPVAPAVHDAQRVLYPELAPIALDEPPAEAFAHAAATARAMGWEVVHEDAAGGLLQAVATTFWFGFRDDVVVRARADGDGSVVDVRSVSRVGLGDAGANAARIRAFRDLLQR
jgi:uncharacterized protein (DUF1499 family)